MSEAERVLELARAAGVIIATAESCTGGMVAAALTDIAGSSDVFERGFVTYSNAAKVEMLGVDPGLIEAHGAVSETGIAGPGGSEHKPEGRVCFGLAIEGRATLSETVEFGAVGRADVRRKSVRHALSLLGKALS